MTKELTRVEAWDDFWAWIRQPEQAALWSGISRPEKNYLFKADWHARAGKLGWERTHTILSSYAPERYEFRAVVVVHL